MNFYNWLNEFKISNDSDYPGHNRKYILFNTYDTYKIKGKTHGVESHSIKHFQDFNPTEYDFIIKGVIEYLKGQIHYISTDTSRPFDKTPDEQTVINTLDLINDKKYNKEYLSDQEYFIYNNFIKKMSDKYEKVFTDIINSSINITNANEDEIKKLLYSGKNLALTPKQSETIYFNLKTNMIGIKEKKNGMATLFKAKNNQYIIRKILKKDFTNVKIKDIFQQL